MIQKVGFQFAFCLIVSAGLARADSLEFKLQDGSGKVGSDATTDLVVESSKGMGAFQLNLSYDDNLIEPKSVDPADNVNALVEFNILSPGNLRIAFASGEGLQTDGAAIQIVWNVKAAGSCSVHLSDVRAWEQATGYELPVSTIASEFEAIAADPEASGTSSDAAETDQPDNGFTLPVILGLGLGAVIAVLLLILVVKKSSGGK